MALTGCGVIYTVPKVHEGAAYSDAYGTEFDLAVVPMTYQTAAAANLEPYVPPRLPAAFQPDVVEATMATAAALLDAPTGQLESTLGRVRPGVVTEGLPPTGQPQPYRIGVGDVLLLSISGARTLERLPDLLTAQAKRDGYTVQDDGAISVPDAGRAQVAGRTLQEAEYEISQMLLAANIEPSFSLEVAEFNSQFVSVGGAVGKPSLVPITLQPLSFHRAIAQAGGLALDDPGAATIQLLRGDTAYRFGADRYISDPRAREVILRDGDSVYVAGAEEVIDLGLSREQERLALEERRLEKAQALFEKRLELGAIERYYVFLTGEVRNSGQAVLPFEQSLYLTNILFGDPGGGINIQTGDFGAIYVIRAETDPRKAGGLTAYHLDAENVANLAVAGRFEMRPNDIVFVAEQPVTSWNRVLSQLFPLISAPQRVAASVAGIQ